jgi:hypothetical protein
MRVKLSINDAERRYELHARRLEPLLEALGARPLGPWRGGMDAATALTSAYYAETLEREYEFEGPVEQLKELAMGAEYVRIPSDRSPRSPFILNDGDSRYLKVCDIDVYYFKKGFLGGWFKVHSRSLAKQRGLSREELLRQCVRRLEQLLSSLPEETRRTVATVSQELVA